MDCCGFSDDDEGYKAWNANMYFNCTEENTSAESCAVPWSCCVLNDVRNMEKNVHRHFKQTSSICIYTPA